MYHLSEIWIYPIKSLGGVRVTQSTIQTNGLECDRNFMLVDAQGTFISQRQHPLLNQLHVSIDDTTFCIRDRRNDSELHIPKQLTSGKLVDVTIWNDTCTAHTADRRINDWFSEFLNRACTLVYMTPHHQRQVDPTYAPAPATTTFTDGYPFLIIGQAALDGLNEKLDSAIDMKRFRPNFVFTGGLPHDEDQWNTFRLGDAHFQRVKPCSRCVVTTIDERTSKPGQEPLKTLANYRKFGNKIFFGQNLTCIQQGQVEIGDVLIPLD